MAGLIPPHFIQDVLARTDIVQVLGERLELKRAGREYVARSPFTNEKTPSFYVNPSKQMFFDFSSGKNGNVITFLMEFDRMGYVEAIEYLAGRLGLDVPREGGGGPVAPKVVLDGPLDALAAAERIYKAELRKSPEAIEYLKQRGLTGETAKRFGIGFAPEAWDTIARQLDNKHALDAGLLVKNDSGKIYDFYRRRIMFPVRNVKGQIITFGGRVLPGSDDNRKYLNGRETPLFDKGRQLYGLYEARQGVGQIPFILVVEGYMDVVMLAQHGIPHAVATMGTATTRDHLNLLFKSTQRVVFCFDGDRAGRAAAWRALEQALPEAWEGREMLFMFLPDNAQGGKHDPDSFVRELGAEEFKRRVGESLPLSKFLISELTRQVNLGTPEGRAKLAVLARPHLAKLREGPLRTLILDELSRSTRLSLADLEAPARTQSQAPAPSAPSAALPAMAEPVRRALQLLMQDLGLAKKVGDLGLLSESDAEGGGLLVELIDLLHEEPGTTLGQLLERWRGTDRATLLTSLSSVPVELDEGQLAAEFSEQINKLQSRESLRRLRLRYKELAMASTERELAEGEKAELAAIAERLRKSV